MHTLITIPNFVSELEETEIINNLPVTEFVGGPARNKIHRYGRFLPTIENVISKEIPDFLKVIYEKMLDVKILKEIPDVVSVNEYYPGQGIDPHIDSLSNGEEITILGLGSHAVMNFTRKKHKAFSLFFEPRMLVQMKDEVRYKWQHSIEPKFFDMVEGVKLLRTKRYSVVFRKSCFED